MKIKFTKGELKKQRDALRQYVRYLPTLQLKKQQLQAEILLQSGLLEERRKAEAAKREAAALWSGLLFREPFDVSQYLAPKKIVSGERNIAGVAFPFFVRLEFDAAQYDLFVAPLWLDTALDALRAIVSLRREIAVMEEGVEILRRELRVATQRVNLFEKVKIPEAEENIRRIKIYLGDQEASAVVRSKIAKRKIENAVLEEVAV